MSCLKKPRNKEEVAYILSSFSYDIKGVSDLEDSIELNTFIVVMDSGRMYYVEVTDYGDNRV